jgi:hypothetical protein
MFMKQKQDYSFKDAECYKEDFYQLQWNLAFVTPYMYSCIFRILYDVAQIVTQYLMNVFLILKLNLFNDMNFIHLGIGQPYFRIFSFFDND